MKIDLTYLRYKAQAAIKTDHNPYEMWYSDGLTLWSGKWPETFQQHPLLTSPSPYMEAPPRGTAATLAHVVANRPAVTLALVSRIEALESALLSLADILEHNAVIRADAGDIRELVEKGAVIQ